MRKAVIAFVFSLFTITYTGAESLTAEQRQSCTVTSQIAEEIMTMRQEGVPLSNLLERAGGDELLGLLIQVAYESPRASEEARKQEEIDAFRDAIYRYCHDETINN